MPIGIVSDSDFDSELSRSNSVPSNKELPVVGVVIDKKPLGRPKNSSEVPDALRKVISDENTESGRASALELANEFGISPSSVSAYSNGATSTSSYNQSGRAGSSQAELNNHVEKTKEKIGLKARNRLVWALNAITSEKLETVSVKVASEIAKNMAAVVKDMESDNKNQVDKNKPVFVFYSPQTKSEKSFEVIDIPNE